MGSSNSMFSADGPPSASELSKAAGAQSLSRHPPHFPPLADGCFGPLGRTSRKRYFRCESKAEAFVHQHDELLHWLREFLGAVPVFFFAIFFKGSEAARIWGDLAMELLTEEEQFNWRLPVPQ